MKEEINEKRSENRGYSFQSKEGGSWYLVRCHQCGKENYAMAVATGICAWCGYDDNKIQLNVA